jgi:hypothetical protein
VIAFDHKHVHLVGYLQIQIVDELAKFITNCYIGTLPKYVVLSNEYAPSPPPKNSCGTTHLANTVIASDILLACRTLFGSNQRNLTIKSSRRFVSTNEHHPSNLPTINHLLISHQKL